jgi:WD40 repeat protein
VYAVDISPDGGYVFSASADKTIRLWNLELKVRTTRDHNFMVLLCAPVDAATNQDRNALSLRRQILVSRFTSPQFRVTMDSQPQSHALLTPPF